MLARKSSLRALILVIEPHFGLLMRILPVLLAVSCTSRSANNQYLLAERLWDQGKHEAAVIEFGRVYARDSTGKLGHQALFRRAMTEALFLSHYSNALSDLRILLETTSDSRLQKEAKIQIGEVLFLYQEDYELAALHYRRLIEDESLTSHRNLFKYRLARSLFFLSQFDASEKAYRELIEANPGPELSEKSNLDLTLISFVLATPDDIGVPHCKRTLQRVADFEKRFPQAGAESKALLVFAKATCLGQLDQGQLAAQEFETIKKAYPTPGVIEWKIQRLRDQIQAQKQTKKVR